MPIRKPPIMEKEVESDGSTDKEADGDNIHRSISLENYTKQRELVLKVKDSTPSNMSSRNAADNRSIEIFFGKLTNFPSFYESLADNRYKTHKATEEQNEMKIHKAEGKKGLNVGNGVVKKLCLVGHPLTSFKGLNKFKKLSEAWVTNCAIEELKWSDFDGLDVLQRLYLFGGRIAKVEPLYFENLRVLWLSGNKLTSLNFLTHGLSSLVDLNVAKNQITCLEAEHLFKCVALQTLNVAANPLCTIQDVQSVNVLPSLRQLYLIDPVYGKCPVSSLCDSRAMLVHKLCNITNLNGKEITLEEQRHTQEYVNQRCLYYYASALFRGPTHVGLRKLSLQSVYHRLEHLGVRILDLATLSARCLQADYQMSSLSAFTETKQELLTEVAKIHTRISGLKQWARVIMRRSETLLRVSRWEQEMDDWLKWVEFQSYGTISGYIGHSALDSETAKDKGSIRGSLHQIISGLSCSKQWPVNNIMKIESVVILQDKGAEAGMEKIHEDNYSRKYEPKFQPPPIDELEPTVPDFTTPAYPFYGLPSVQPMKIVTTYTDPNYRSPTPVFPYPESIPGLPERSQPLLMFVVCPVPITTDPLTYFHNLFFEKSRCYKDVRLTNCVWMAAEMNNNSKNPKDKTIKATNVTHSIVCLVKVLDECLVSVSPAKTKTKQHCRDCQIYRVTKALCFAPAYILYISHSPADRSAIWYQGITEDSDVTDGVEVLLEEMSSKLADQGCHARTNSPYYLHRTHDGVKADLTAISTIVDGKHSTSNIFTKSRSGVDLLSVAKFLGTEISQSITSLDLSGNRLGLTVGLEGLGNLKKLNLSHNNLTTLSGIHKLPHLRELRAGWNYLRFVHSNITTLSWACSKLVVLELLPNPFQDIRDYHHIPFLAKQALPALTRVDAWTAPFIPPLSSSAVPPNLNSNANFTKEVMKKTWVGYSFICSEFKAQCLNKLDVLQTHPPLPEGQGTAGLDLDLSDNYLLSSALKLSPMVQNGEWKTALVKLQLQENAISTLNWMENCLFPNLRILNLSNNVLNEIKLLESACPNLMHLQICCNPFPCNPLILAPLRCMKHLLTLDASRTSMASHPDYSSYVLKFLRSVQILDGTPMIDWNTEESVYKLGGNLSTDWIEVNVGKKDWSSLTELSLPRCGIQKINFPSTSLPKLLSLDLTGNNLQCLTGLASLPNLRVLCVSHNNINSLGDTPCPSCFSNTADYFYSKSNPSVVMSSPRMNQSNSSSLVLRAKTPERNKFKNSSHSEILNLKRPISRGGSAYYSNSSSSVKLSGHTFSPPHIARKTTSKSTIFPQLEVLVLSHNGLNGLTDLHLHALPSLRTVILSCNKIKGFEGLDNLSSIKAIVLDNNHINNIPFSCFAGSNSLKHLHLEHNRISAISRMPHLTNLVSLFLGYNKIQSLTDMSCLASMEIDELTLIGNPTSYRNDYSKNIFNEIPNLRRLDGANLTVSMKKGAENYCIKIQEKRSVNADDHQGTPYGFIPDGCIRVHPHHDKLTRSETEE